MPGISCLFHGYFGSKWRSAVHYPPPKHDVIVEPFAGSAGYSHLYPERQVWLYDAYPPVVRAWRFLVESSAEQILALPVDFHDLNAVETDLDGAVLSQGARDFIGYWLCGVNAHPSSVRRGFARSAVAKATSSLFWGPTARQLVANQVHRVAHWNVTQVNDYSEVPNREATWFVDPPYHVGGEAYGAKVKDFTKLGEWCRSLSGQVIACEQEGATWLPFVPLGVKPKGAPGNKSRGQYTREVVWHRV